jgi:beta-phosphoglucomutase family hydrolase
MKKGAIFDMDGVLVDNVRFHVRAWQQLGREFGKELSDGEIRRVFGQRNREMIVSLIGRSFSEQELTRHTAYKEEIYREIIAPELVPAPGLTHLLAGLAEAGIKAAVATSGPMDNVSFVLNKLDLGSRFSAIVTGGEVFHGKPAPDIFLLAARRIGLPAGQCVVFEDSTAGIEAARRAGIPCIALSTTHTVEELARTAAIRIVPDFTHLRASDILNLRPAEDAC